MEDSKRVNRRRHAADLKRQVLAACAEPGASVAQVALAYGLNANLVYQWRRMVDARGITSKASDPQAEFVSLTLAPAPAVVGDSHLELRRSAMAVNVTWPLSASDQCVACLREILPC
jgi:transposase